MIGISGLILKFHVAFMGRPYALILPEQEDDMATYKGGLGSISAGHTITRMPLVKRYAIEIGDRAVSGLILPASVDAALEIAPGGTEVELRTGWLAWSRLVMSARVGGRSVRMGPFSLLGTTFLVLPLFWGMLFFVVTMGAFFMGFADERWSDWLVLGCAVVFGGLGVLRFLTNLGAWLR